jgi:Na+/proline symporter
MILAGSLLGGTPDSAPVVGPAEPISWMVLIPAAISLALQPALWLRYRAAASAGAVRRGAVIVFVLAVVGFVLVAGLIGREARALYPLRVDDQWQLNPNARVDPDGRGFDRVLPTLLVHLPTQTLRPVISAVLLSGLLAAAIATVGVNLRAIGTLFVRDIYVRAFHPRAGLGERIAVCRIISALAAAGAVFLVIISRRPDSFRPLLFVSELAFLGPALLLQLLPLTSDILTFRKGNRHAAALGLIAGLGVLALFHPVTGIVASTFVPRVGILLSQFQGQDNPAFAAIAVNLSVFVTISILAAVLNRSKSARNLLEPAKPLPTQARAAEPLTAGTEWSNREAPLSTG